MVLDVMRSLQAAINFIQPRTWFYFLAIIADCLFYIPVCKKWSNITNLSSFCFSILWKVRYVSQNAQKVVEEVVWWYDKYFLFSFLIG